LTVFTPTSDPGWLLKVVLGCVQDKTDEAGNMKGSLLTIGTMAMVIGLGLPAKADLPMEIAADMKSHQFTITVPNIKTDEPAYGGRLRIYDVHIAKMVEVTDFYCTNGVIGSGRPVVWQYYAGSGRTDMGRFELSCNLARDLAIAYGVGATESTLVDQFPHGRRRSTDVAIPTLNIRGSGKINSWLGFTNNFKPTSPPNNDR
jgi:hypothetical protein